MRRLHDLWQQGLANADIARRLGRNESAVAVKASRLKLPPKASLAGPAKDAANPNAKNGMSVDQFQAALMNRVAEGGCFDPNSITSSGDGSSPAPMFLMPWIPAIPSTVIMPGQLRSL